jgi:ketosteroid isomerase-like protein
MSAENVEIVRRLYRAMEARDLDAIAELAHRDAEWISDRRVGERPVRGLENVIRFFSEQDEMLADLHAEPERLWETDNDKVLVFVHTTGRGRASDAPFDIRIAHLWTLEDGLVVRGEGFANRDEALQAVEELSLRPA